MGHSDGVPRTTAVNILNTIQQLAQLGAASADVVEALQAIRAGYSDEAYERFEEEHPLVAALVAAACEVEAALEMEG